MRQVAHVPEMVGGVDDDFMRADAVHDIEYPDALPLELARNARALGVPRLVAVAVEGETDPALAELVDSITWLRVGQLSKMIAAFTDHEVRQCVMVGQVAPKNLFDLRPDFRAMTMLFKVDAATLKASVKHQAITATLVQRGDELWLEDVKPVVAR